MPILILPNKLNHAVGRRGEGECRGCWDGWVEGREGGGGTVVNLDEQLSAWSDQDILGGESLIGSGWRGALMGDGSVAAGHVHEKAMMAGN